MDDFQPPKTRLESVTGAVSLSQCKLVVVAGQRSAAASS